MGVALTLLFYITPVFYQSQTVGEKYRILYELNPIAVLIQGYQSIFFLRGSSTVEFAVANECYKRSYVCHRLSYL